MNNKYKILLVEDEHNISTLIMTMLESSGYQVIRAGTCALAKTLFVSHCPYLVLLDLGLPDMDGMTFLEDVRKDSLTPIIVLSASSYIASGMLELEKLGDLLHVTFDTEEYGTLNGFMIDKLERIPNEDEECIVVYKNYRFTVLEVNDKTIQREKIEKLPMA